MHGPGEAEDARELEGDSGEAPDHGVEIRGKSLTRTVTFALSSLTLAAGKSYRTANTGLEIQAADQAGQQSSYTRQEHNWDTQCFPKQV